MVGAFVGGPVLGVGAVAVAGLLAVQEWWAAAFTVVGGAVLAAVLHRLGLAGLFTHHEAAQDWAQLEAWAGNPD